MSATEERRARDIAEVPAIEVINTVAVHLLSAAAVKLGLADDPDSRGLDLDEARKLIIGALAGLVTAGAPEDRRPARSPTPGRPALPAARVPRGIPLPRRPRPGPRRKVHRARSTNFCCHTLVE